MNPSITLHAFAPDLTPATALAAALGYPCHAIDRHCFPDGESLVRVAPPEAAAIVYCRLDRPNEKLIELLLAADALTIGSRRPILVAPYLPYMRQDVAFHDGEAVSQRIVGRLLGSAFSTIITVEPHLHRTGKLSDVVPGAKAVTLSAAPALAELVDEDGGPRPLLVGPDVESGRLVSALAKLLRCDRLYLEKHRSGDRSVAMVLPPDIPAAGRYVLLVDDICSTGATLAEAARLLKDAGAISIEALVVHAGFDRAAACLMREAGITRIRSTDSLAHPSNAVSLTHLLTWALERTLS